MPFQIHNPLQVADWDEALLNDHGGFFHTAAWAAVLAGAYRFRPVYFTHIENNRLAALLPVMEINSFLTGKRGVSLPFTDCCSPVAPTRKQLEALIGAAIEHASEHRWRSIEFRTGTPLPLPAEPERRFKHHTLPLQGSQSLLEGSIRKSTLRNARRAERAGVRVARSHSLSSMREFHRLNGMTRKHHGLPPQPWYFFEALFENVVRVRKGAIFLAMFDDKPVAGAVFLHFRKQAVYKYGASDGRFHHLRANNLVMWEALRHYCESGYRTIDFGRTEADHQGLLQYKRGWGAQASWLYYYRYDTRGHMFLKTARTSPPGYGLLRILPIPILRMIGHFLYPHVG